MFSKDQRYLTTLPGNGYKLIPIVQDEEFGEAVPVLGFLVFTTPSDHTPGQGFLIYPATEYTVHNGAYKLIRPDGSVIESIAEFANALDRMK